MLGTQSAVDLRLCLVGRYFETPDVVVLDFATADDKPLPRWQPGAHLELRHPNGLTGHYSLCGDPASGDVWRVAVQLEQCGRGSSKQTHALDVGDRVDAYGPINNFPLDESPRYHFVAGGIGITPILPMLRQASERGAEWQLSYGGRSRQSMAFAKELAELGERVHLHPQDQLGLLPLDDLLGVPTPDTLVYCCGPEPLLAAVEAYCRTWPAGSLHVERFTARATPAGSTSAAFDVILERRGTRLSVGADQSILDAVLAAGVDHPFSCTEGVCGTCETAVLRGVVDHRDSILDEDERRANETMMICVSRSATAEPLVLDL
jgi:ferredoxin-NADP reductase